MQEPLASRDAAISCLVRLSAQNVGAARTEAGRNSIDPGSETLPLSRLVTLAAEFGLQAEWIRLDWQGLKTAVADHPVLIVHSNTEVVVITAGGRSGAEEVSVWDPKHDGVVFFVWREDVERTWSGHALLITAKDAGANIFDASPAPPDMPIQQTPPRISPRSLYLPLGVAATVIVAIGGIVLFLLTPPGADQTAGPGATTRLDSLRAQNPLVNQRQAASAAGVVVTTSIVTTPKASSLSATPTSTGPAARPEPDDAPSLGAAKREADPARSPDKVFAVSPAW